MRRIHDYNDSLVIDDDGRNNGTLLFLGANANLQRDDTTVGPFPNLKEDPTHWLTISAWIVSNSLQWAYFGVPLTLVRLTRHQTLYEMDIAGECVSSDLTKIIARDVWCNYGLGLYFPAGHLTNTGVLNMILHVRGQYEQV